MLSAMRAEVRHERVRLSNFSGVLMMTAIGRMWLRVGPKATQETDEAHW